MRLLPLIFIAVILMLLTAVVAALVRQARAGARIDQRLSRFAANAGPGRGADDLPREGRIELLALRSGLPAWLLAVVAPTGLAVVATLAFGLLASGEAAIVMAVCAGVAVLALRIRLERRSAALQAALPGFLDAIRQQLLVGASIPQAMQRALPGAPPLVRQVFEPVERRVQNGAPLAETLAWAATRHGGAEMAALVAAVSTALRFGGRLSQAIGNLSEQMRARLRIGQELKAATAEVRISALVLGALPLLVGGWLFATTPGYRAYFTDPAAGRHILFWLGGLYLLGIVLLRQVAKPRF